MVLALGAVGWMIVQYRKSEPEAESVAEELVLALERTIADLRAEPDPRKAVIAAYAQMELALAEAGLPRDPAEAPREYLGRVLPEVGAQNRLGRAPDPVCSSARSSARTRSTTR